MTGLGHDLISLALELAAILGAVAIAAYVARRRGFDLRVAAGGALALATLVVALGHAGSAGSALRDARRDGVGARGALEHCFEIPGANEKLPFVRWLKHRLPARAIYELVGDTGVPDPWCRTLVLLPMLPAGGGGTGDTAQWEISFGTTPPDLNARIARHDRSVRVFAPGYAVARVRS